MTSDISPWRSLKTRVTLFALGIFLIGIWSLAFYSEKILRQDMERLLGEHQFSTAAFIAADIDVELRHRLRALEIASGGITAAMLDNAAAMQASLEHRPVFLSLFNGGIFVTRMDGIVIADAPRSANRIGVNYLDRDYMVAALKEGKTSIGKPVMGRKLNAPIIGMAAPIHDARGKVIGSLTGVTNLGAANFLDEMTENRYGKSGGYLLVAPQHRLIVTATDKHRIMETLPALGLHPQLDRFLFGYEGSAVFVNPLGVEVLASSKHVPVAGWNLAVLVPTAEAFAPFHTMRQRLVLAAILLTLLLGALIWWMLKRQLEPMFAATQRLAAMTAATDQPLQALPITRQDEVGQLISSFNRLIATVTEREKALHDSRERFDLAVRGSSDGIWDWNILTDENYISDQCWKLMGYEKGDPRPAYKSWTEFTHPDDHERMMDKMRRHLKYREPYDIEFRALKKNGDHGWFLGRGQAIWDERGWATRMAGSLTDISARKQAEAARASLEAQLRESQKMEAIGTLAGGIAHDFNNILAAILGNAQLAREDANCDQPQVQNSLDEISKAGKRGRDLVQQILSFSRRQPSQRKRILLCPVIEEAVRLLRATLPARLTLAVECAADLPAVLADANQIVQVVVNLATNAMQAVGDAPGQIRVKLDAVSLDAPLLEKHPALQALHDKYPGSALRLAVSDDGQGMDAATLERIFEPFFTTKPVGTGTGLGLSVVHGVVQAHDGAVVVESQLGRGTTFMVYLPAGATQPDERVADTNAEAANPLSGVARGQHLLYIDDDESLVFLMVRLLERRGYRVSGYADPSAALAALRADPGAVDLVVTDYNMPGTSGLEVARAVRAIRADLPVAVVSGFIDENLRARADEAGVRQLIFKATEVEELCEAFARLAQTVAPRKGSDV